MDDKYLFDSSEINSIIYRNYSENKLCYLCITPHNFFADVTTVDYSNLTVVDKLKFICKETEDNMFPPSNLPLNICTKCLINIEQAFFIKSQFHNIIQFWQRFFNLSCYPNINIQNPILTEGTSEFLNMDFNNTSDNNNLSEIDRNSVLVNDLKNFLNFKNENTINEIPSITTDDYLGNSTIIDDFLECNKKSDYLLPFIDLTNDFIYDDAFNESINITDQSYDKVLITPQIPESNVSVVTENSEDKKIITTSQVTNNSDTFLGNTSIDPSLYSLENNCFYCIPCKRYFKDCGNLVTHLKTHIKSFICKECNKKFYWEQDFDNHMVVHSGNALFKCDKCLLECKTKNQFDKHLEWHVKAKNYVCKICGSVFKQKNHLQTHLDTHNNMKHKCHICGKEYITNLYLKSHLKEHNKTHNEPNFQCSICDEKYYTPAQLKQHGLTHNDQKLYVCQYCGKSFTQKSTYNIHVRIHLKIQCRYCKKEFNDTKNLIHHMKTYKHNDNKKTQKVSFADDKKYFEKENAGN